MALPNCRVCDQSAPGMVGLMVVQYGHIAGLPPEPGYFYLCPSCYEGRVKPFGGRGVGVPAPAAMTA